MSGAVMQLLLSQYSSSKDVAVLTAMAGRPAVEVEPLVGWFACGCAIRTNLEGVPAPALAWPARPQVAKSPNTTHSRQWSFQRASCSVYTVAEI